MREVKKIPINTLLIGVIVALGLTFVLGLFLRAGQAKFEAPKDFISSTLEANTNVITITSNEGPVSIVKTATGWEIKSPTLTMTADADSVKSLLESTKTLKINRLVSKNEEANKKLGFGEPSKTLTLDFSDGSKSMGTYVLTNTPSPQGEYYIQKQGSQEVYAIGGLLNSYLSRSPSDWVNKRLVTSFKEEDIDQFSVKSKDGVASFQRASDKKAWSGTGAQNANKATATEITPLLHQILGLTATKVETLAKADFDARVKDLVEHFVVGINGKEVFKLLSAKTPEADYLAVFTQPLLNSEGKLVLFTLPKNTVGDLKISLPQPGTSQGAQ